MQRKNLSTLAHTAMPHSPLTWDIFCRVVDNFGDAAICWRLARQIATERQEPVRLWIDAPGTLQRLVPEYRADASHLDGVEIRPWHPDTSLPPPNRIVIEGFGCPLPGYFLKTMAGEGCLWINLEYLSAEEWVEGCHGLPSRHPRLPLVQHYFYPGFTTKTGGLIRESDALADTEPGPAFSEATVAIPADALLVSYFAYPQAPLPALITQWEKSARPVCCLMPGARDMPALSADSGFHQTLEAPVIQGSLTLLALPFLSQRDYDDLLRRCDLNFVRGEDSFIRAQWAARPLVWQPYAQADDVHVGKLQAFLRRYGASLGEPARTAWERFNRNWTNASLQEDDWSRLLHAMPALTSHAGAWRRQLTGQPDLLTSLVDFVHARL